MAKTCIITGASRGIGLATALRFAKQGYAIVAVARNQHELDRAVEHIRDMDADCLAVAADVGHTDDARRIVRTALDRFGRVDVLVNNAGTGVLVPIDQMQVDDYERTMRVNVDAIFHTTQAVWSSMKRQGGGVIVNISSVASSDPFDGFAVYGASKAWVNVFSKACAAEGRPHKIRVYAVAPGAVETRLLREVAPGIPPEVTLDPDAVAAVIESVCDERMAYATGQTIFVKK
jgi:NAD(P)-dependent dehydrogenase (short-subunit alcohol dehydrogenase family)